MAINPARLRIIHYPDPALREPARPVANIDQNVREVAARMLELMHEAPGVGLAAPQVGLPWRLFVANPTGEPGDDAVYVNPVLSGASTEAAASEEGCLSIPHVRAEIMRAMAITIDAVGLDGKPFQRSADGLEARIWQHEADHLDGILIIDRMTPIDRRANLRALRDLEEEGSGIRDQGSARSR